MILSNCYIEEGFRGGDVLGAFFLAVVPFLFSLGFNAYTKLKSLTSALLLLLKTTQELIELRRHKFGKSDRGILGEGKNRSSLIRTQSRDSRGFDVSLFLNKSSRHFLCRQSHWVHLFQQHFKNPVETGIAVGSLESIKPDLV